MNIPDCRPYHAVTSSMSLVQMPDGKSVHKIYYLSIIGRDKPELYEWERCAITKGEFEEAFRSGGHEGIGVVTDFPHITKVFRFGPSMETVLDIQEFDTDGMTVRDCSRDDGYHEFACYAEAVIAAEEYHAWAKAESVEEYLRTECDCTDFPVVSHSKLQTHYSAERG